MVPKSQWAEIYVWYMVWSNNRVCHQSILLYVWLQMQFVLYGIFIRFQSCFFLLLKLNLLWRNQFIQIDENNKIKSNRIVCYLSSLMLLRLNTKTKNKTKQKPQALKLNGHRIPNSSCFRLRDGAALDFRIVCHSMRKKHANVTIHSVLSSFTINFPWNKYIGF